MSRNLVHLADPEMPKVSQSVNSDSSLSAFDQVGSSPSIHCIEINEQFVKVTIARIAQELLSPAGIYILISILFTCRQRESHYRERHASVTPHLLNVINDKVNFVFAIANSSKGISINCTHGILLAQS